MKDSDEMFAKRLEAIEVILGWPLASFGNSDALLAIIAYKYILFLIIRAGREKVRVKKRFEAEGIDRWMNPSNSRRGGYTDLDHMIRSATDWAGIQTGPPSFPRQTS